MTKLGALILLLAVPAILATSVPVPVPVPAQTHTAASGSGAAAGAQFAKESGNQEHHDDKHLTLDIGHKKGASSEFNKAQGSVGAVAGQGQYVHQQNPGYGYPYNPYPYGPGYYPGYYPGYPQYGR